LYSLTWKTRATPAQRLICALRAWARPTSGSDSSGWPTARATDGTKGGGLSKNGQDLVTSAQLAGWATPVVNDSKGSDYTYSGGDNTRVALKLGGMAKAAWPTPMATDGDKQDATLPVVERRIAEGKQIGLAMSARLTAGPTPTQRDWKGAVLSGETPNGSGAATASGGQLSPAFSAWLQGYPEEWCRAAIRASRSIPRKRG